MERLILHAGPHKTASTYIQELLLKHRDALKARGVAYPDLFSLQDSGHHLALKALRGKPSPATLRRRMDKACGAAGTCLLSDENLYHLNENMLRTLARAFADVPVRVVLFVRRPSMRLRSLWQERVKHGGRESLAGFLLEHCLNPLASRQVNLCPQIDLFRQAFGADSVALVDYDTASAQGAVMASFLAAAGIDALITDTPWRVNPMFPLPEAELIRYLNLRAHGDGLLRGTNARAAYDAERDGLRPLAEEFGQAMVPHARLRVLGNIVCDLLMAQLLQNQYSALFRNALSRPEPQECYCYEDSWLLDPRCRALAEEAYALVQPRLTA